MEDPKVLWKWESDPAIVKKKCVECNESMFRDRASAVTFKGEVYHIHCLLNKLTKHYDDMNSESEQYRGLYNGG